ncbi:MAG: hypothetical protein ABSG98_05035 [Anaerolineales bacterium]|jgi:hypothetical protein
MKNAILIVVVIALLASLAVNGGLYLNNASQGKEIQRWQAQNRSLSSGVATETTQGNQAIAYVAEDNNTISALQGSVGQKDDSIASLQSQLTNLRATDANMLSQLSNVMCSATIPASDVIGLSTNQALIEPVTKALEQQSGLESTRTEFEVVWNYSKTAIFTVTLHRTGRRSPVRWLWFGMIPLALWTPIST